jgi:hypothetical protein
MLWMSVKEGTMCSYDSASKAMYSPQRCERSVLLHAVEYLREAAIAKQVRADASAIEECTVCTHDQHCTSAARPQTTNSMTYDLQSSAAQYVLQVRQACVLGQPVPHHGCPEMRNATMSEAMVSVTS